MLLFQYPGMADKGLLAGAPIFKLAKHPEASTDDYQSMWGLLARPETDDQAAAITAGLNWYR